MDTNCRMQKNEVTSLNAQPLLLKVVVRPVHGHFWHSPWTQNPKPTRLPGSRFRRGYKHPTMVGSWGSHLIILQHFLTTIVYCSNNCLLKLMCLQINKPFLHNSWFYYFPRRFRLDMYKFFGQILLLPTYFSALL